MVKYMEQITWQVVVIIVGGITAFLTFLYNMLASKKQGDGDPWKSNVDKNDAIVREQIIYIKKELDNLRYEIEDNDDRTRETLEKFEKKLERFTEIIIEHLKK